MPVCSAFGCNNRSGSAAKAKAERTVKLSFHLFPLRKPDLLAKWLANVGRKDYKPTKSSCLCSDHFLESCYKEDLYAKYVGVPEGTTRYRRLKEDAVPTEFSHRASAKPRETTLKRLERQAKKKVVQELLSKSTDVAPVEKPIFHKPEQLMSTPRRKRKAAMTVSVPDMPEEVTDDTPISTDTIAESPAKRRKPTESVLSKSPTQHTTPAKLSADETTWTRRSWVTPQKVAYGTPRRTQKEHSYSASLFRTDSTQTSPGSYQDTSVKPDTAKQQIKFSVQPTVQSETETASDSSEIGSPEHVPSSGSSTSPDTSSISDEPISPSQMNKYIVFEQNLEELHKFCNKCGSLVVELAKFTRGSMVGYNITCHAGHSYVWHSQPMENQQSLGNLLISSALLTTGGTYAKISSFASALNLQFLSESSYYKIQRENLLPVIQEAWEEERNRTIEEIKSLGQVVLAGDARCDSPGHTAKYGSYTLMHVDGEGKAGTRKIVSMNLVQVSEVKNSNHMEPVGMERCLKEVTDQGLQMATLATDRHIMVGSIMKKKYPEISGQSLFFQHSYQINHQYDVWHVAKSIVKQLNTKAKTKACDALAPWIQSISNHLWWACSTCGGDEQVLREKWLSVLHHVTNKHRWSGNVKFHKCAHPAMSTADKKATKWLKPDSPAFTALKAAVTNTYILKSLAHLTEFCHTGELEVFHSMLLKHCPKRQHFQYDTMSARLMLAAIEWNNTAREEQIDIASGQPAKSMIYSKRRKAFVFRQRYTYTKSNHSTQIAERVLAVQKDKIELPAFKRPEALPKLVSGVVENPAKSDLEKKFKSRFTK